MSNVQQQNRAPTKGDFTSYDVFILIITLLALIVMALIYIPNLDESSAQTAFMLDTLFSLVFLYDFFRRFINAPDRGEYFLKQRGWLDLLGVSQHFRY